VNTLFTGDNKDDYDDFDDDDDDDSNNNNNNNMINLLTAIGLTPGGSSTLYIYTQAVHRTTQ
jgi:hypothetical protein